jgi:hypothetical protein
MPTETEIPGMWSLPDSHYAAIGKVAANWAALELYIDSACWILAKVDDKAGVCLTAQVAGIGRKLDAFTALVRLQGGSDALIKSINKFAQDAQGLSEIRNRVVHDPWHGRGLLSIPHRVEASARKKVVFETVLVMTSEVDHIAENIATLTDRFEQIMGVVRDEYLA